jgi:CRP/FNR family nitrogen fixation transcriptional regulator
MIAGLYSGAFEQSDSAALTGMGVRVVYARGETIFNEGDEAAYSYLVVSGAIRLCKHLADGRRQIADFVLPGDYCGFLPLAHHRFTAEAASDLEVISYPQRKIEALGERLPEVRRLLAGFMGRRLMAVQDHLVMLGRHTAKERVMGFLLLLLKAAGAESGERISLPMNRQDIADYLGLTIETVCRVLSTLKRTRLITTPDLHSFSIRDVERFRDIVEFGN